MTHRFLAAEIIEKLNRFRVISTVFERLALPVGVVQALDHAAQIWTACKANADSLIASGIHPSKVRIAPVPFFNDDPLLGLRGRPRKPGPPRFYHIGKWEPRKSQDRIILAFLRAFKPVQAQLIVRSSPLRTPIVGYPQGPLEAVAAALEDADVKKNGWTVATVKQAVEIITEPLSDAAIVQLHAFGDVYVTLSKGEGFDMPAFDAKLAGNMMIYTSSGGPQDFADEHDYSIKPSGLLPCHSFYGWEEDAKYLDFLVEDAVVAMCQTAREVVAGAKRERAGEREFLYRFSAKHVGQKMLKNLQELVPPGGKVF